MTTCERIVLDWQAGSVYDICESVVNVAIKNGCDDVVFEFNGSKYSVSRGSHWNEDTCDKIMDNIGKGIEVKL